MGRFAAVRWIASLSALALAASLGGGAADLARARVVAVRPAARLAGGAGPATSPAGVLPTGCAAGTEVQTDSGTVCGNSGDGYREWLGIPFAAPPQGNLRWQPPQRHAPWAGTLAATASGAACPQARGPTQSNDEDCLTLDVVTPAAASSAPLPVMVWIYGGAFNEGATSLYNGVHLAAAGQVIFVAVSYRVGVLGFLAEHAFGPHSGDYGLEDQQAGLAWVQRNIAAFGGNPRNVTIFGQSAGGASVCDQLASPAAAGLFQRAISESGEYNNLYGADPHQPQDCKAPLPSQSQADAAGASFAAAVGCGAADDAGDDQLAACLRSVPVTTLLAAQAKGLGTQAPVINGTTLTASPQQAFATGRVNARAVIMGAGRDEDLQGSPRTAADYTALITAKYGHDAPAVLTRYPLNRFASPYVAFRTVTADSGTVCPALVTDERIARSARVYAYENDDADAPLLTGGGAPSLPNGVYHAAEIPFLFPDFPGSPPSLDPDQQVLADQVTADWASFAYSGQPTAPGTPGWSPFTTRQQDVMSLQPAGDSEITGAGLISADHHCDFWNGLTP